MANLQRPSNPKADMPEIAAWIDELRAALGKELIDKAVRDGLKNGGFWAIEKGFVIGTPPAAQIREAQRKLDAAEAADTGQPSVATPAFPTASAPLQRPLPGGKTST